MSQRGNNDQQGSSQSSKRGGRGPRRSDKPNAVWSEAEQKTIVDFLHTKRSEGGDQGTFKKATMNALVEHLRVTHPTLTAKDYSQVEGKWKSVSSCSFNNSHDQERSLTRSMFVQIKGHLVQVNSYKELSGRHWDPVNGANIEGTSAEITWEADVKQFSNVSIIFTVLPH